MLIDCDNCGVRGQACAGCVVRVLFGGAPPAVDAGSGPVSGPGDGPVDGDGVERRALQVLADAGFEVTVLSREDNRPRLRLVGGRRRGHAA